MVELRLYEIEDASDEQGASKDIVEGRKASENEKVLSGKAIDEEEKKVSKKDKPKTELINDKLLY